MANDPWLIVFACKSQRNAQLMLDVIRDAGVGSPAVILRKAEADEVLADTFVPTAKAYNQVALNEMAEEKATKGRIMAERTRKSASRGRIQ